MDTRRLLELKTCLEEAAAAGTNLVPGDVRLRAAVEALAGSAASDPACAEICAEAMALLSADAAGRPAHLLDTLALLIGTLRESAQTDVPGEFAALEAAGGSYEPIAYSRLKPVIEALTSSGSGRITILTEAWESHPEYFSDARVHPYIARALSDPNEEMEELLSAILLSQGKRIVPALEEDFTPDSRRETMRRVYWAARLAGPEANGWLLSILPESQNEVRETVIAALGVSQDNAALLQELYGSETGKCRDAALRALAWMGDEQSRALWTEELERRPDCPPCLEGVDSPLAADMAALVLHDAFSEALERERKELGQAELLTLAHAVYAVYGKYSDALREEWLWCAGQIGELDRIHADRTVKQWDLTAAEMLEKCLLETVLWNPCEGVRALAQELAERAPGHFLGGAVLVSLLTGGREAFDRYGKYIVKNGFLRRESAAERANRVQIMRALAAVQYGKEKGRHIPFSRKDAITGAPAGRLYRLPEFDPRWEETLSSPKVNQDGSVFDLSAPWSMTKQMLDLEQLAPPAPPAPPAAPAAAEET